MVKIVLCDDDKYILEKMDKLLQKYQKERDIQDWNVKIFHNSDTLMEDIESGKQYDIYFLDMLMPEKSGIDVGRQVRRQDDKAVLIYLTSSPDFALEAYGVLAQRYLLKPIKQEEVYSALDYALEQVGIKPRFFLVKTSEGTVKVSYEEIEYIESESRVMQVHLRDGELITSIFLRKSFEQTVGELISDKRFCQIHKSYLISLSKVSTLQQGNVIMESGAVLPISKSRQAEVKRIYLKYVSDYYR